MTARRDLAWWRQYIEPMDAPYLVESAETVLDGLRGVMTPEEISDAERLIATQRSRLGMGLRTVRRMG